jgi:glutathione S-transferase
MSAPSSSSSTYKLIYFAGRGLAETSRMVLKAAGQEFEDYRYPITMKDGQYERPEWEADKSKYTYEKIPVLEIDGGKYTIAQSKAIERFLARRFNMFGNNEYEAAMIGTVNSLPFSFDLHSKLSEQMQPVSKFSM